jgi:hypothetical protein
MLYRLLTAIGLLAAAVPAAAEPGQLSSEAIRTTLAGALVNMDTPAGTIIPVRFGTDGLVSGMAGVLAPVLGAERDRGRWWAERDRLCMKWFRWFEAETRCVSVRMDGERIYWRGEDRSGTATVVERPTIVEASAPKRPAATEKAAIELADSGPAPAEKPTAIALDASRLAPAAEATKEPEREVATEPEGPARNDRAERLALRFAAASLGGMTFAPPTFAREVAEPRHLLAAPEREAISAASEATERAPAQAAPVPKPKESKTHAQGAQPKAPQIAFAAASSTMILASFRVARVDDDDMLNVRSGPAEFYPPVGGLPPQGRGVTIVGPCREDWCPIRHGKIAGWVNRHFLAEETAGPATAVAQ